MADLKTVRMTEDVDELSIVVTFKESTDLTNIAAAFSMRKRGTTTRVIDWATAQKEDVTDESAVAETQWRLSYNFGANEVGDYEGKYRGRFRLDFGNGEVQHYPEDAMIDISFRRGV